MEEKKQEQENKYKNGKIYKISDINNEMIYIGSTSDYYLSNRLAKHTYSYRKWKEGLYHYVSVFDIFEKYGVENCKIHLIEKFSCENKKELEAREGHIQRENNCINKNNAGMNRYGDKKNYFKKYYIMNKEKIKLAREQKKKIN